MRARSMAALQHAQPQQIDSLVCIAHATEKHASKKTGSVLDNDSASFIHAPPDCAAAEVMSIRMRAARPSFPDISVMHEETIDMHLQSHCQLRAAGIESCVAVVCLACSCCILGA